MNVKTSEVFRTPAPGCEDLCIDHPHVNPLFEGRSGCRYVYASLSNEQRASGPPLGYVRVDVKTGETQKWYAGNKTFCEELVVVQKDGKWVGTQSSSGFVSPEEEQECWLLGMLADHEETPEGEDVLGDYGRRRRERRAGGENLPQAQSAARTARRLRAAAREVAFKTNLY